MSEFVRRARGQAAAVLALVALSTGPAMADTTTIAAFGDSLTAGYGLPEGEGFVPRLQGWLDAAGEDATVLNAGVSGDTTASGRARLDWVLSDDVDAVILELGANDFLRGLPPEVARENLTAIMEAISARDLPVLLVGVPAPANYGLAYKTDFDAIYPDLATAYGALLYPDFIAPIRALTSFKDVANVMQADGIHPNARGVEMIVEAIGPDVRALIARASN